LSGQGRGTRPDMPRLLFLLFSRWYRYAVY